jgi:hypothetical protein
VSTRAEALEIARVVGVLDAWAKRGVSWTLIHEGATHAYVQLGPRGPVFYAFTPAAARAAAARAIERGEV